MVKKALSVVGVALAVLAFAYVALMFAVQLYVLDGTAPDWMPSWMSGETG